MPSIIASQATGKRGFMGKTAVAGVACRAMVPWAQSARDIRITLGLQVPYEARMNWPRLKSLESV
jgi:hypothetical protein